MLGVDEQLARVYALAGQTGRASALGDAALRARRVREDASAAEIDVQLALARAAMTSGELKRAAYRVATARAQATDFGDHARLARATSLAAQVAVEQGDLERAADLAERALQAGAAVPEVCCEANETLGRCYGLPTWSAPSAPSRRRWRARTVTAWPYGARGRCTSWRLRLPAGWPWADRILDAIDRCAAIPAPG